MLEDKGAQNHHPGALFPRLPIGVEVTHPGHLPRAIAIDAANFGSGSEIEIAGVERYGDRDVKRRRLGVHVAAVKIAVATIDARRPFRNACVERLRRAIRLRENPRGGVVGMIPQLFAGFGEQLHARAVAQRWQWKTTFARPREWIGSRLAGNSELPFPPFIVRFEVLIAERPVNNVVPSQVGFGTIRVAALDFIGIEFEITGYVAR